MQFAAGSLSANLYDICTVYHPSVVVIVVHPPLMIRLAFIIEQIEPVIVIIAFMPAIIAAAHQLRNDFEVILHLIVVVVIHGRRRSCSGCAVVREMSAVGEEMVLVGGRGFGDVVGVVHEEFLGLGLNLVVEESVCGGRGDDLGLETVPEQIGLLLDDFRRVWFHAAPVGGGGPAGGLGGGSAAEHEKMGVAVSGAGILHGVQETLGIRNPGWKTATGYSAACKAKIWIAAAVAAETGQPWKDL
nr:hypothetical protein Iba_chr07eCG4690 [Ipomoea batatas]